MFKDWTPAMRERLECTKEEDIERRDVYDVIPSVSPWSWTKGRVALLGDAVHAVQVPTPSPFTS
jgi:zeaxanthin epoxidase